MSGKQGSLESLDLSFVLRTIMAARGITVAELAEMAGVSKSAMEKYLAGPSSPRATAIASLSKALGISADTLLFGEIDANVELAFQVAFREFAELLEDLVTPTKLGTAFRGLEPGSDALSEFVRNTAFERAGSFKRAFNSARRDAHFGPVAILMPSEIDH